MASIGGAISFSNDNVRSIFVINDDLWFITTLHIVLIENEIIIVNVLMQNLLPEGYKTPLYHISEIDQIYFIRNQFLPAKGGQFHRFFHYKNLYIKIIHSNHLLSLRCG
jgi:hypothetical protein